MILRAAWGHGSPWDKREVSIYFGIWSRGGFSDKFQLLHFHPRISHRMYGVKLKMDSPEQEVWRM